MKFTVFGASGSVPCPLSPDKIIHRGACTTCFMVEDGGETIIIDAGTGIINAGNYLLKKMPVTVNILLSHLHWDHIQGIPFFVPMYIRGNIFHVYGGKKWSGKLEQVLEGQMQYPTFPISLEEVNATGAEMGYFDIFEKTILKWGGLTVKNINLNHPGKSFGYRIENENGKAVVIATDTEHYSCLDFGLADLAKGADLLVYDAQYTEEEYQQKIGWGHSTPNKAAEMAKAAKVKRLILTHHDPSHDDKKVKEIEEIAKSLFSNSIAAYDGLVISL